MTGIPSGTQRDGVKRRFKLRLVHGRAHFQAAPTRLVAKL
jgi:hypothetical protein